MRFDILTIFPGALESYLGVSILKRAVAKKKISIHFHDIRKVASDRHRTVDDRPYGGGVGMVMKVEPIVKTLERIPRKRRSKVLLMSAGGKLFTQTTARSFTKLDQLILIAGRYEGVDARINRYIDGELSVGEYVLTGGELPAMVIVDAVSRLLPGVLGKDESSRDESHSKPGMKEYPQYTRPEKFRAQKVPKILLSGDHTAISKWRAKRRRG